MPYLAYNNAVPVGTQTGPAFAVSNLQNQRALADAIVAGTLQGWDLTVNGPDFSQPSSLLYANGTDQLRATLTWTASGNPQSLLWESNRNGAGWERIGLKTITYSGNDEVTAVTWS